MSCLWLIHLVIFIIDDDNIDFLQRQKMGQNPRMVEEAVINLENQRLIALGQAENFIEDYHTNSENMKDLKTFVDTPNLTLFLKYYIANKYPAKNNIPVFDKKILTKVEEKNNEAPPQFKEKTHNLKDKEGFDNSLDERMRIQNEVMQYIISEIQKKVLREFQKIEQVVISNYEVLCQMLINNHVHDMKNILQLKISQILGIQDILLIEYDYSYELIQSYDSRISFYDTCKKQNIEFENLYSQYFLKANNHPAYICGAPASNRVRIRCTRGNKDGIMQFTEQQNILSTLLTANEGFPEDLQQIAEMIVRFFMEEFLEENYLKHEQDKHKNFFNVILKMLEFSIKGRQRVMKIMCSKLLSIKANGNEAIQEVLKNCIQKQNNAITKQYKPLFSDISKYSKRIKKQLNNIKMYLEKIEKPDISYFMDFDRYGQLKFCYGETNENLMLRLKNCYNQRKIKVIDIMSEYHSVIHHFRQAIKGNFKSGVISSEFDEITCQTFINENQILDRFHLEINKNSKKNQTKKKQSTWVMFDSDEEAGDDYQQSINDQEQLIRDLEKQNPDIKASGWLNLFVKNSMSCSMDSPRKTLKKKTSQKLSWDISGELLEINNVDFDMAGMKTRQAYNIIKNLISVTPLIMTELQVHKKQPILQDFVREIEKSYNHYSNPFHNFSHTINTMHICYLLVLEENSEEVLSEIEIIGLLIAALCHDMGHPGTDNNFEVNTFSKNALTYNDISPIQNASANKCLQILRNHNFLESLSAIEFMSMKNMIVQNILSTDFTKNQKILKDFSIYEKMTKQKRLENSHLLTSLLIHSADYSHFAKHNDLYTQWSQKLYEELQNLQKKSQTLKQEGGSITLVGSTKKLEGIQSWISGQREFAMVVILPLYKKLKNFYEDSEYVKMMINNIVGNGKEFQSKNREIQIYDEI